MPKTRKLVYDNWGGKCAFCGAQLTVEDHHIIAVKDDPSLIDDPNNLVLLCSNHHSLTRKKNFDGSFALSINDIRDLKASKYCHSDKFGGFYFDMPASKFAVKLANGICYACPQILLVNGKPLIELKPTSPVWYEKEERYYLYARFFDRQNNFIGGMFANNWASVSGKEWKISITDTEISVENLAESININFKKTSEGIAITGVLYYDEVKIEATSNYLKIGQLVLHLYSVSHCNVAFAINSHKQKL